MFFFSIFQKQKKMLVIMLLFQVRREGPSQIYSCSIVGCDFTTSTLTDLDVHLGEHELLDEEQVVQYEIFEQVTTSVFVGAVI